MMGCPALFDLFVNNILKEIMNKTSQLYLDLIINKRMYFRSWLDNILKHYEGLKQQPRNMESDNIH